MKIAILGAGAFGTALGGILADNGYDIDYYDSKIQRESLSETIADAKYIVLAIPSNAVPYVLPYLPDNVPLIIATKGLLSDKPFARFKDYMVLSGPGFAQDIKARKRTLLTLTDKRLEELFKADYMEFDYTDDEKGVLMCGALKNVYALLAGFKKVEKGSSEFNQYVKDAGREMKMILEANGADEKTVDLACGMGDLKLTCYYPSRNYEFGRIFRDNPKARPEKTVEGLSALKRINRGEIELPEGLEIFTEIQATFSELCSAL